MTTAPMPAPLPPPGPQRELMVDSILAQARREHARGDRDAASRTVAEAMRLGLWSHAQLWTELVSMMEQPADYRRVRQLWLDSPRRCHRARPILRAVACAAAFAGEHDEARALLRRAILQEYLRRRRPRNRFARVVRRIVRRPPASDPSPGLDLPDDTLPYLSLLDAVAGNHREQQRQWVEALRDYGEGDWLDRL